MPPRITRIGKRTARWITSCAAVALALGFTADAAVAQALRYPVTPAGDQVDDYFGTRVPDPYRWLESDTASAVRRWIEEQNAVTFRYLDSLPFRPALKERLTALMNYRRISLPTRHRQSYVFTQNDGLQNQGVLYIQRGFGGPPEVLLDPNALSSDGTTRLAMTSLSHDARYLAYGLSRGGSDWMEIRVMEIDGRKEQPDRLQWVKISGAAWWGNGFFYSRFDAPEDPSGALTAANENHRVFYHRLGTLQSLDSLVFEDPSNPRRFHFASTSDDGRYLYLSVSDRSKGTDGNALYAIDLLRSARKFIPISEDFEHQFRILDNLGDQQLVVTDYGAPNRRVVLVDLEKPEEGHWRTILPERREPLRSVSFAGGMLITSYLKDVVSKVYTFDLNGVLLKEIALPGPGTVAGFSGRPNDPRVFFSFSSFTAPPTTYLYDVLEDTLAVYRRSAVAFDLESFETRQVFYQGKDGTRIPMFIVAKKGLRLDGSNPLLLYGYGGFNISIQPAFNPLLIALLEQGCVYAVANIRGGGEYGEAWHMAGTKAHKQNVFSDFIAAAEWLVANRYTSPARLAIQGGSNGGLLVGAVVNQRPDLFRVALPAVGVMDMLRYHTFTIGSSWISDYGSSQDSAGFRVLYAYSPLHNIREGGNYPALLATTADHDDRVVPAHTFKYIATLQARYHGPNPVLLRVETRSGHGASSTTKAIDLTTDTYAFMMYVLGMTPDFTGRQPKR